METIINRLLANDMEALQGLHLDGELPLKDELLNNVLKKVINQFKENPSASASSPKNPTTEDQPTPANAMPNIDLKKLLDNLHFEVYCKEGEMRLKFDIEVK